MRVIAAFLIGMIFACFICVGIFDAIHITAESFGLYKVCHQLRGICEIAFGIKVTNVLYRAYKFFQADWIHCLEGSL